MATRRRSALQPDLPRACFGRDKINTSAPVGFKARVARS